MQRKVLRANDSLSRSDYRWLENNEGIGLWYGGLDIIVQSTSNNIYISSV